MTPDRQRKAKPTNRTMHWRCDQCGYPHRGVTLNLPTALCHCGFGRGSWRVARGWRLWLLMWLQLAKGPRRSAAWPHPPHRWPPPPKREADR